MTSLSRCRVSPFGYRRVFASLQLGAAFRSSVRPSSVSSGQASSVRPCLLDQLVLFVSTMCFLQDFLLSKTVFLLLFSQCLFSPQLASRPLLYLLCLFFKFVSPVFKDRTLEDDPPKPDRTLPTSLHLFSYFAFSLERR